MGGVRTRPLIALLAVLAAVLGSLALAAPAHAAEQVVTITTDDWDLDSRAALALVGGRYPNPTPSSEPGSPGRLDSPPTLRGYGLPSALAAVLAAGIVSLLVRLLLAEPAARRRTPGPAGPTAGAAVD